MEEIEKIKKEVLKKIKPTKDEKKRLLDFYNEIKKNIKKYDNENLIKKIDLVGSVSKDTFLKDNRDLDIFMFFSKEISKEKMEEYALEIGKNIFLLYNEKYVIKYAEHPYVKGKIRGFDIELVPAYLINKGEKIRSAVDRTLFHKEYIINNLKEHDEVRILKKFMKSVGVYGSELYINGFSGYACELFIIKYKSFENFLKNVINFKKREVICLSRECDEKKYRKRFRNDAIILVDPVDENRNVCSSVSIQNLAKIKLYARLFLSRPSINFFFLDEIKINKKELNIKHKEMDKYWFVVEFKNTKEEIKDTIYPQLEKFRKYLLYLYEQLDFKVERSFSYIDDNSYGIYFEFGFSKPAKFRLVKGPEMFVKWDRIKGFIKKYKVYWIDDKGMLKSNVRRKYILPEDVVLSLKELEEDKRHMLGVPKSISRDYYTLQVIKDIMKIKNEDFFKRYLQDSWKIKWALKT